jgi:hypothetical protein
MDILIYTVGYIALVAGLKFDYYLRRKEDEV